MWYCGCGRGCGRGCDSAGVYIKLCPHDAPVKGPAVASTSGVLLAGEPHLPRWTHHFRITPTSTTTTTAAIATAAAATAAVLTIILIVIVLVLWSERIKSVW